MSLNKNNKTLQRISALSTPQGFTAISLLFYILMQHKAIASTAATAPMGEALIPVAFHPSLADPSAELVFEADTPLINFSALSLKGADPHQNAMTLVTQSLKTPSQSPELASTVVEDDSAAIESTEAPHHHVEITATSPITGVEGFDNGGEVAAERHTNIGENTNVGKSQGEANVTKVMAVVGSLVAFGLVAGISGSDSDDDTKPGEASDEGKKINAEEIVNTVKKNSAGKLDSGDVPGSEESIPGQTQHYHPPSGNNIGSDGVLEGEDKNLSNTVTLNGNETDINQDRVDVDKGVASNVIMNDARTASARKKSDTVDEQLGCGSTGDASNPQHIDVRYPSMAIKDVRAYDVGEYLVFSDGMIGGQGWTISEEEKLVRLDVNNVTDQQASLVNYACRSFREGGTIDEVLDGWLSTSDGKGQEGSEFSQTVRELGMRGLEIELPCGVVLGGSPGDIPVQTTVTGAYPVESALLFGNNTKEVGDADVYGGIKGQFKFDDEEDWVSSSKVNEGCLTVGLVHSPRFWREEGDEFAVDGKFKPKYVKSESKHQQEEVAPNGGLVSGDAQAAEVDSVIVPVIGGMATNNAASSLEDTYRDPDTDDIAENIPVQITVTGAAPEGYEDSSGADRYGFVAVVDGGYGGSNVARCKAKDECSYYGVKAFSTDGINEVLLDEVDT